MVVIVATPILEAKGLQLQDHQRDAVMQAAIGHEDGKQVRLCLYHRTGAGKTITSLSVMAQVGVKQVLVLAPPVTVQSWKTWGEVFGIEVEVISHAKFRQKTYKVRRDQAMIVDEFHLLGGHTGLGWTKIDRLARGLQAPLVICSATPSYNDAERVYCVQHVLDPQSAKGGFLQFVYEHCITEVNPFGTMPKVTGFRGSRDAEEYLSMLDGVCYVEDELIKQVVVQDVDMPWVDYPQELEDYGLVGWYDAATTKIVSSIMEERHVRKRYRIMQAGVLHQHVLDQILYTLSRAGGPVLLFSAGAKVAEATYKALRDRGLKIGLVTGTQTVDQKESVISAFRNGLLDYLIGTATLATGTDGIDKMCDAMLIVEDTDDDSLRRQLMGRILPRGLDVDVASKRFWRLRFPN
jgi:hypothetical protein